MRTSLLCAVFSVLLLEVCASYLRSLCCYSCWEYFNLTGPSWHCDIVSPLTQRYCYIDTKTVCNTYYETNYVQRRAIVYENEPKKSYHHYFDICNSHLCNDRSYTNSTSSHFDGLYDDLYTDYKSASSRPFTGGSLLLLLVNASLICFSVY